MGGGAFKRPPPAGGGKSRGPAGRGLRALDASCGEPSNAASHDSLRTTVREIAGGGGGA